MIALDGVSLRRGGALLIDSLSLRIERGQVTVLIGPNGAGKSTLLHLAGGLLAPGRGRVSVDGAALSEMAPADLAGRRAVLGQQQAADFTFTVGELARLGYEAPGFLLPGRTRDALVERALDRLDLGPLAGRTLDRLSGGERQRAHLARVLVQLWAGTELNGPGALLLDEPTSALDLSHQLAVTQVAREHAGAGGAVLAVLHDHNMAAGAADRIIVLDRGRIAADGTPAQVLTEDIFARVFGVRLTPGRLPPEGVPFLAPQTARRLQQRNAPPGVHQGHGISSET